MEGNKFWAAKFESREKLLQDYLRVNSTSSLTFSHNCYLWGFTIAIDSRRGHCSHNRCKPLRGWHWRNWRIQDRLGHVMTLPSSVILTGTSESWFFLVFWFGTDKIPFSWSPWKNWDKTESLINTMETQRKKTRVQIVWLTKGRLLVFNLVIFSPRSPGPPSPWHLL